MKLYGLCKEYGYCVKTCGLCADIQRDRHMQRIGVRYQIAGERNFNARLNWELVQHIRSSTHIGTREMGRLLGISHGVISLVRNHKIWRDGDLVGANR